MAPASATALLSGVVDYDGLFPPAGQSMSEAAREYQAAMTGPHAWMLGRFVAPAARLEELAGILDREPPLRPWHVSAIVRDGSADDVASIRAFNGATARTGARVDNVECKPAALDGIDWLAATFAPAFDVYVELAPGSEIDARLARVAALGLRAKVRTGGLTADAFPTPAALAGWLGAAVRHGVPFKATAGLHHAVRGSYRLTYEPASDVAPMYGYLNVLFAVAALEAGQPLETAIAILQRGDAAGLTFDAEAAHWGAFAFSSPALRDLRARRFISVGSCSFSEPAAELEALIAAAQPAAAGRLSRAAES
jgi:hypothetical protein